MTPEEIKEKIEINEAEIDRLHDVLQKKRDKFMETDIGLNVEAFMNVGLKEQNKIEKLGRENRMLMIPEYEELPTYGTVMSLQEFIGCVKVGGFIDYDGFGSYVKDGKESNIRIYPSDVKAKAIRTDFDTIIWYNR